jgi:hypothetical protein
MDEPAVKAHYHHGTIEFEEFKSRVLAVDIYYDRLEYTQISQVESMSTITLVSNVGGLSGCSVEESNCFCLNLI